MDDPSPTKQPKSDIKIEQIQCDRCSRIFTHFVFEDIQGIVQLRCGDVIIPRIEAACIHCGWIFRWGIREKDIPRMAIEYGKLLNAINMYNPE